MEFIHRILESEIKRLTEYFSVLTITGARQSGKTTLCKKIFPNYAYINLEDVSTRTQIIDDTKAFLNLYPSGLIIDEAHHYPDLFSYIQVVVDEQPERKFILTGSSNFSLLQNITQSLAGRTAVLTLLPLSLHELGERIVDVSTDTLILKGGYPAIWAKGTPAADLYRNYYTTYIERDVRQIVNLKDIGLFQRFIKLAAGRIGTECNNTALASQVGTSATTIYNWFHILAASYIAYPLPPYHENIGKRLVKTPKLYFYDTGLACYLLGIENEAQLSVHPLKGALFENLIINEAMKNRLNKGKDANLYFFRDKTQREVDLLHTKGSNFYIYEIKSSQTYHSDFMKGINYLKNLFNDRILKSGIIYDGETMGNVMNFRDFYLE